VGRSSLPVRHAPYRRRCRETVMICWSLLQSAVQSARSAARTLTSTSQMLAATVMGTCRVVWFPLSTSTMVTLTSPPVMTGWAAAGRAGTARAPAASVR